MDAMILFLKKNRRKDFTTTDITLSNWSHIDQLGAQWAATENKNVPDLILDSWLPHLPAIDIWLKVEEEDIHHVIHLFLGWDVIDLTDKKEQPSDSEV